MAQVVVQQAERVVPPLQGRKIGQELYFQAKDAHRLCRQNISLTVQELQALLRGTSE